MNYSKILKILIYVLLSVSPITGFTESHEISRRLIPSGSLIIDSSSPAPGAEINLVRIACNVKTHRGDMLIIKISESRLACISNPVSFSSEYRGGCRRCGMSMKSKGTAVFFVTICMFMPAPAVSASDYQPLIFQIISGISDSGTESAAVCNIGLVAAAVEASSYLQFAPGFCVSGSTYSLHIANLRIQDLPASCFSGCRLRYLPGV